MKNAGISLLLLAAVMSLFSQGSLFSQECLECHSEITITDGYPKSVHAVEGIICEDCHSDVDAADDGHEEVTAVNCASCHDDIGVEFKKSIHAEARGEAVISCKDCHGYHEILEKDDPRSSLYRLNISKICSKCHLDQYKWDYTSEKIDSVKDYFGSVHGTGVSESGLIYAATCSDCHGSHKIRSIDTAASIVSRINLPKTCANCHPGIYREFIESVHGKDYLQDNKDVPICNDCHESHRIYSHLDERSSIFSTHVSGTCSKCHDTVPLAQEYHLPGLRQKTYMASYHGAASELGDTTVANCGSCHGYHDIKPSSDPSSSIHTDNLSVTCGKCHLTENPSQLKVRGKIHLVTVAESHWITLAVKVFYIITITGSVCFFFFYITTDVFRYWRQKSSQEQKR